MKIEDTTRDRKGKEEDTNHNDGKRKARGKPLREKGKRRRNKCKKEKKKTK